jgi:hypothetical protein
MKLLVYEEVDYEQRATEADGRERVCLPELATEKLKGRLSAQTNATFQCNQPVKGKSQQ